MTSADNVIRGIRGGVGMGKRAGKRNGGLGTKEVPRYAHG